MTKYDYLIVGAGLSGSICAYELTKAGYTCLVIDKRKHIGGNIYTEKRENIDIHKYGPHIFHTNDKKIWDYINQFDNFNNFINSPIANYKGEIYNLPFNMNTFAKIWDVTTPDAAKEAIQAEIKDLNIEEPKNLEEQALSMVGRTIYEKLVKGYTEKQWGTTCDKLPVDIIKRLPLRFTYDNNYFNDKYQGIPEHGYTYIIQQMLQNVDILLNTDGKTFINTHPDIAEHIIYTGSIDEYYDYCYGVLDYRSLLFVETIVEKDNYQGNAVINYTDAAIHYTRVIEHKFFNYKKTKNTIITYEYPIEWDISKERYYSINNNKNNALYKRYKELNKNTDNIIFCGRLGTYQYLDMDKVIKQTLNLTQDIIRG